MRLMLMEWAAAVMDADADDFIVIENQDIGTKFWCLDRDLLGLLETGQLGRG